jgi:5'-deoxynucleotidase YfbR-like HD superfamily hydrolase
MEPYIGLLSGDRYYFREGHDDRLRLSDVAAALSKICRYNGQCKELYVVAQHAVYVSKLVESWGYPQYSLWGLFHDNSESIYGDMSTPFKVFMDQETDGKFKESLKKIDKRVNEAFYDVLLNEDICHFTDECRAIVKQADVAVYFMEREVLLPNADYLGSIDPNFPQNGPKTLRELDPYFEPWAPKRAEHLFIKRFEDICKQKPGKAPASA